MEEETRVEEKQAREPRAGKQPRRYTAEERLKAVRLHLQEGFPQSLVCEELGMGRQTLMSWVKAYREYGEGGLTRKTAAQQGRRLPGPVRDKIIELKRENGWFGVKKIALVLQRWFFLQASPETVRQTLHEAGLMEGRPKPRRNLTRPRFFERATPNQMWQSDLFTFRLGGKYAYVVAFLDDYSRYVVSLGLYRSPTAEAVIETYRRAVGEYSPPKEMLTDRGRQYTNWRGKSRFEVELQKDRVVHIVSRPQHPMTLGKIERFWATMWQEFLVRAQFDSFDEAQERLRLWVKYYNHRRPHQGIGGLSPADRFFEIQSELKQTIQTGIQENLLELALRGQPKSPFYLVGRLDGQSVVLKAEKGKLKLTVDEKELIYDLKEGSGQSGNETNREASAPAGAPGPVGTESAGGPGGLDGPGEGDGRDAGTGSHVHDGAAVAGTGAGGDAPGVGAAGESGERRGVEPAIADAPGAPAGSAERGQVEGAVGASAGDCLRAESVLDCVNGEGDSTGAGRADPESALGPDDGGSSGRGVGRIAQDLLRVGTARTGGDVDAVGGSQAGATKEPAANEGADAGKAGGAVAPAGGHACPDGGTAGAVTHDGRSAG
jgi:transposase InsO family protein/transposase-like protein